ncbi:MAG: DUF1992 domain-containing protein [Pseudonocardia sp.]|nr:DUF1992 domain-containing protein [Pseudonocardia sp.]
MYAPDPRYETAVDRQIREAQEQGYFDDLPGKGKPLPGLDGKFDENWWIRGFLRREGLPTDALLPASVQLRKEIDRLPETVRTLRDERWVRDLVDELNVRIVEHMRFPSGPRVPVRKLDPEAVVARWRAERPQPVRPPPPVGPVDPAPPRRSWWTRLRRRS